MSDKTRTLALNAVEKGNLIDLARLTKTEKWVLNAMYDGGMRLLHFATQMGHTEIVEFLLQNKVDTDATTSNGETALQLAVLGNHYLIVQAMIAHQVFLNPQDKEFRTPLDIAFINGSEVIAQMLLMSGAESSYQPIGFVTKLSEFFNKYPRVCLDFISFVSLKLRKDHIS